MLLQYIYTYVVHIIDKYATTLFFTVKLCLRVRGASNVSRMK